MLLKTKRGKRLAENDQHFQMLQIKADCVHWNLQIRDQGDQWGNVFNGMWSQQQDCSSQ